MSQFSSITGALILPLAVVLGLVVLAWIVLLGMRAAGRPLPGSRSAVTKHTRPRTGSRASTPPRS